MKRCNRILMLLAAVMVLMTAGIGSAWAYFTTYASAKGGYTIQLGDQTQIQEDFSDWTKHVSITSQEDSQAVYVRVKAFCGSAYELTYSDGTGTWNPGDDGYYYYSETLKGGETTPVLDVHIGNIPEGEAPESFNVAVVYETTPVQYEKDGTPYADWSMKLETGDAEGGGAE